MRREPNDQANSMHQGIQRKPEGTTKGLLEALSFSAHLDFSITSMATENARQNVAGNCHFVPLAAQRRGRESWHCAPMTRLDLAVCKRPACSIVFTPDRSGIVIP
jgi:hypothetical protein